MSSTQDTKTTPKVETLKTETNTCCKDENTCSIDNKTCDKKKKCEDNKECCRLWNFFRSKIFYFILASGSVASSYLIWKKFYKRN